MDAATGASNTDKDMFDGSVRELSGKVFAGASLGAAVPCRVGQMLIVGCGKQKHTQYDLPSKENAHLRQPILSSNLDIKGFFNIWHHAHSCYVHKVLTVDIDEEIQPDVLGDFFSKDLKYPIQLFDVVYFERFPLAEKLCPYGVFCDEKQMEALAIKLFQMLNEGGEVWAEFSMTEASLKSLLSHFSNHAFRCFYIASKVIQGRVVISLVAKKSAAIGCVV